MHLKFKLESDEYDDVILEVTVDEQFEIVSKSCSDSAVSDALNNPKGGLPWLVTYVHEECSGVAGSDHVLLTVGENDVEFKITRI